MKLLEELKTIFRLQGKNSNSQFVFDIKQIHFLVKSP